MHYLLLLLATACLWLSGDPAHADPITGAIAAFTGWLGTLGVVGKLVLGLALQVGGSLLQRKLARKKDRPVGVDLSIKMGDDVPMGFVVGKYATAGRRKYAGSWGQAGKTPNAYLTDVIEISSLPSNAGPYGITALWINEKEVAVLWDQPHEDGRGYPVAQYRTPNGTDHLWVKYLDGSQTTADPFLRSKFGSHPDRPWKETMIGRGCQALIVTCRIHQELFRGGLPQILVEPHPLPLYDPRKDSTNGGSGPHRWSNSATWQPTVNPIVIAYNIKRGIYYGSEWVYGGQSLAAFRLPVSSYFAGMNECDAGVETGDGGMEPAYRCGYEIYVDQEPLGVLEELAEASNARFSEMGGIFKVLVGLPGAAVYSFSDDDIIVTEKQSFEPFPSLDETYNAIEATYPEPREKWAAKDAPGRYDAALEAEDGNRRLPAGVSFDAAPFAEQVQRLMVSLLKDYRRWRKHQFYLPPDAYALEVNDEVSWTSERNGYSNKKFLVTAISGNRLFNRLVTLKEVDPSDYDWNGDLVLPPVFGWTGDLEPPEQPMTGWTVQPDYLRDAAGNPRRPSIRVGCAVDMDDVQRVWVKVRLKATGDIVFDSDSTPYGEPYSWVLGGNFLPLTEYEVRGKYVPLGTRKTAWSAWLPVTTPDIKFSWEDLHEEIRDALEELKEWIQDDTIDQLIQDVQDLATGLAAEALARANAIAAEATARVGQIGEEQTARVTGAIEASDRYRALVDEITALRDRAMEADFADFQAREEIRRSLSVSIQGFAASFDERITVAASDIAAVAQRTTTLEASTVSLGASISAVDQARVAGEEALAQQIAYLTAGNLNQFDQLHIWFFDAGAEGWTGNGAPTVAGGYLRPANHASEPYCVSPDALAASATTYSQVRARIRRVGAPVWRGQLWWMTTGDATWDEARRATIAEPAFDGDGNGLITFTPPWTGTIARIRIDLSEAQTATDYMEIDWAAVGRPSPGASVAELAAERLARISALAAQAADIVTLQAQAASAASGITGLAAGVSALETSVEAIGDDVTAMGTALDALSLEVDGKAELDVVNQMSAEIETLGAGISNQGSLLTAIRATLLPSAMEMVDQDFANFLGLRDGAQALATATTSLNSRIDLSNSAIDLLASAVTQVQVELPNLAKASAVTALEVRVTATEAAITVSADAITAIQATLPGKASVDALNALSATVTSQGDAITALGSAVTSINAALPDKASVGAVTALTLRVDAAEGAITSQADAITAINTALPGKASVAAVNSLSGRVDAAEGTLSTHTTALTSINSTLPGKADVSALNTLAATVTAQGDNISTLTASVNSINATLPGKASVSALNALQTQVNNQGGEISAQAIWLGEVQANLNGSLADARFKMEVLSGPSGYARIGMMARVSPGSGTFRTGGFYLDVPNNLSLPVQAIVEASRFAVVDGATKKVPFAISGGVCYLMDVNIQNAIIGNLQVGTHNLQLGAVTMHTGAALGQAGILLNQTIDAMGITVPHGTESPTMYVFFSCSLLVNGNLPTDGFTEVTVVIRNNFEGALATFPIIFRKGTLISHCFQFTPPARASTQFRIQLTLNSGPGSSNPPLLVNNRLIQVLVCRR